MNQTPDAFLLLLTAACFGLGLALARWQQRRKLRRRLLNLIDAELELSIRSELLKTVGQQPARDRAPKA